MPLSIIPDEISADPYTALEFCAEWGFNAVEIRNSYRRRMPVCPKWMADRTIAACQAYGMKVTAISPGLFKPIMNDDGSNIPLSTDNVAEINRQINELLPRFLDFADAAGTKNIIVFSLPRAANESSRPAIVVDALARAAEKARTGGFTLLLENGGGSWTLTGSETRAVVDAVGADNLKITWDPANVINAGGNENAVIDGYAAVKPKLGNVHIKDSVREGGNGHWVQFGAGSVDWTTQLNALKADGYQGYLTLEPHLQYENPMNLVATIREFVSRARSIIGSE